MPNNKQNPPGVTQTPGTVQREGSESEEAGEKKSREALDEKMKRTSGAKRMNKDAHDEPK